MFAEVEEAVADAFAEYGFGLSCDPWQALHMAQGLRGRGVPVVEYTFTRPSKQRLAQTLLSLLNAGNLRLYEAPGLREELLALRLVQATDGSWAFDHRPGGHDDRAVAISMMAVAALEGPAGADGEAIAGGSSLVAELREALDPLAAGGFAQTITGGLLGQL